MTCCNRVYADSKRGGELRVALLTPFYLQSTVGNAVTVRRIESHLRKLGCVTALFSLDALSPEALKDAVRSFSPEIIHAFHGIRCGAISAEISRAMHLPYIITLTGTDLYRGDNVAFSESERSQMENASTLVAFHEVVGKRIIAAFPELINRVKTVPQGVEVSENDYPDFLPESPFTFLLPAGIRPVKNLLYSLRPLKQLWHRYPQVRLLLAGPVLDNSYFAEVREALACQPFASWLGEVPNAAMPATYRSAHVVLNTSLSEGGMANSILEAMAHSRPVLVSAVEGNRSLISDGGNGFLYSSEEEFIDKAEMLLLDKHLRESVAAAGRAYVLEHCQAEEEAKSYLELYMKSMATHKGA